MFYHLGRQGEVRSHVDFYPVQHVTHSSSSGNAFSDFTHISKRGGGVGEEDLSECVVRETDSLLHLAS